MGTRHAKAVRTRAARIDLLSFKRKIVVIGCVLTLIITLIFIFNVTSSAQNTHTAETVYTNMYISTGDTLWDIAVDNYSAEYGSFYDYLDDIRSLNHISDDTIHAGEYLVIPICR